jgi:hypothetical protein
LGYRFFEDVEVGLLSNLGLEPGVERKAFDNCRKKNLKNLDNLPARPLVVREQAGENPCLTAGRCVPKRALRDLVEF